MKMGRLLCVGLASLLLASSGWAQGELFVYPMKDQGPEQLAKDKAECSAWATQQTGFDPLATPQTPPVAEAPPAQTGGAVRGAARGAAVGAVGGAIAGDAGKGAAVGAGVGAAGGAIRKRGAERQAEQQQQAATAAATQSQQQARGRFDSALRTCLEGRGYKVNAPAQ
jgi:hypothetical protein